MVERSSAEAEYRAMARGMSKIMWIKRTLEELHFAYKSTY